MACSSFVYLVVASQRLTLLTTYPDSWDKLSMLGQV